MLRSRTASGYGDARHVCRREWHQRPDAVILLSSVVGHNHPRGVLPCESIALTVTLAALPLQTPPASGPYRITHTYTLGGDGGWDYIVPDPPSHRLFIGRTDRVMVVDENSGTLVGTVTGINGAHGTAIVPAAGRGFATSGNDASVVMFDLKSFHTLGRIPAAEDADAIIYDPASNRVFTFNGDAHSSTVIDPQGRHACGDRRSRRQAGIWRVRWRREGLREPDRYERSRRNRREGREGIAALVDGPLQAAGGDGD